MKLLTIQYMYYWMQTGNLKFRLSFSYRGDLKWIKGEAKTRLIKKRL